MTRKDYILIAEALRHAKQDKECMEAPTEAAS